MKRSEEFKDMAIALAKVQAKMEPAKFNRINPHFKSRYADFKSCKDASRDLLAENGIAVLQFPEYENEKLTLATLLTHTSGQWIQANFPLIPKVMDSQGIGSAMTYAKRYSLCGMLGIVADEEEDADDDGEAAVGRSKVQSVRQPPRPVMNSQKSDVCKVTDIKKLESVLDKEHKDALYVWIKTAYKVENLEEIPEEKLPKVLGAFQNAVKDMRQKESEILHV